MADIKYLFCGGNPLTSTVWKVDMVSMSKVGESANYGGGTYDYAAILALTSLGDYLYCGGINSPENKVWKILKSDMSKVAESPDYGGHINALTSLGSHVYLGGSSPYKVWKLDPSDMSKVDESISYGGPIKALVNDDTYLYCAGSTTKRVWKINPSDMSKVSESAPYGGDIMALALDDTYIYCAGSTTNRVYKIRISDMVKVAQSASYGTTIRALTVLGDYVYCAGLTGNGTVWKMDKSDMSKVDQSADYSTSINTLGNDGTYVYCGCSAVYTVWKMDVSDMSKVDVIDYGAAVFTFIVAFAPPVYDYPLAPVMFPVKVRKSTLRQKCRLFEESMSDVCLVLNHNVNVTRRYLQETYGDTTYPESSNFRFVVPSQQLVRLMNKDLKAKDYNVIINNFMTNISSMFTSINENNTLVKTWLDDYMPDELGHDFTDVKMRPIIIDTDMDEDKLSEVMDNLFEGIIDNVTILNMNLEVLKERF